MQIEITKRFIPKGRPNRPEIKMNPEYITVHDTGNTMDEFSADNFVIFLQEYSEENGWHYTVGDDVIYQHLPLDEIAWHCGDEDGDGNMKSIGVEICMNESLDREKAEEKAQELIAMLMVDKDIPIENVVQHSYWDDFFDCPVLIRSRENGWEDFISKIEEKVGMIKG